MVIDIVELLLHDLGKLTIFASKQASVLLSLDNDSTVFVDMYNRNRGRIFDIVREMNLGSNVDMDDLELQFPPAQYGNLK